MCDIILQVLIPHKHFNHFVEVVNAGEVGTDFLSILPTVRLSAKRFGEKAQVMALKNLEKLSSS